MPLLKNLKRLRKAARMGFIWMGTTRFRLPQKFYWNEKQWCLHAPPEETLRWVFRDLLLDDEYGIEKLKRRPQTILDVGANIGMFSIWAGANCPGAVIHAYEPNPTLQAYLQFNASQVGASIFPEGVTGADGRGSFAQDGESMVGQCTSSETGDISVVSLRTAIDRVGVGAIDLLKLDCEGAEWSILEHPEVFAAVQCVRMEYHLIGSDHSTESLVEAFARMGFGCTHLSPNRGFGLAWFDRK